MPMLLSFLFFSFHREKREINSCFETLLFMNCNKNKLTFDFDNYMQFDFKLAFDTSYQKRSDYKNFLKVMIYQGPGTNFNDIEPPLIVRNCLLHKAQLFNLPDNKYLLITISSLMAKFTWDRNRNHVTSAPH